MFCKAICNKNVSPKKAAIKAGFSPDKAQKICKSLMSNEEVLQYIENFKIENKKEKILKIAYKALKKIISSNTTDAVVLATKFEEFDYEKIKKLNLFQISQIKKLKDNCFEFNFIDKLKAIETLLLLLEKLENKNSANNIQNFLNALTNGSNKTDYRLENND